MDRANNVCLVLIVQMHIVFSSYFLLLKCNMCFCAQSYALLAEFQYCGAFRFQSLETADPFGS